MTVPPTALVTRTATHNTPLRTALEQLGLRVVEAPAIQIGQPRDERRLRAHLERLEEYDWLVFTSGAAVERCFAQTEGHTIPDRVRIAVVGPATAAAVEKAGRRPAFMPSTFTTDALGAELPDPAMRRILILRAEVANSNLPRVLARRGAIVDDVAAYKTQPDPALEDSLRSGNGPSPDWVVLASPSAAEALHQALPPNHPILSRSKAACIGPVTAAAARSLGFNVVVEANPHTIEALVHGIREALK